MGVISIESAWDITIDEAITVIYRRYGKTWKMSEFKGPAFVLQSDRRSLRYVPRKELPLEESKINLLRMPVVVFQGSATSNWNRAVDFIEKNTDFQGALLLQEGGGPLDLDAGKLIFTDENLLDPSVKVKGKRPVPPEGFVAWEQEVHWYGPHSALQGWVIRLWRPDGTSTEWAFKGKGLPHGYRVLPEVKCRGKCVKCERPSLEKKPKGLGDNFGELAAIRSIGEYDRQYICRDCWLVPPAGYWCFYDKEDRRHLFVVCENGEVKEVSLDGLLWLWDEARKRCPAPCSWEEFLRMMRELDEEKGTEDPRIGSVIKKIENL